MATYGLYSHIQSNRRRSMALLIGLFFWFMCWSDAEYFLVKNFINNRDQATHASYFKKLKDAVVIEIPKLNEMAYGQVELASVPFLTFVANKDGKGETANYSFVLRGYVRHWLGNVWAEYDRVKLLDLFGAAETTPARAPGGRQVLAASSPYSGK